jgi:hypothetical protein
MNNFIENDKNLWNKIYKDYIQNTYDDIYYEYDYCSLYLDKNSELCLFYNQDKDQKFFFPFIKKKILNTPYFDFESPYGYSGPLVNTEDKIFIESSLKIFIEESKKRNIIAGIIRSNPFYNNFIKCNSSTINILKSSPIVYLKNNVKNIKQYYSNNLTSKIKKGKKEGVKVLVGNSLDDVKCFYNIYSKLMLSKDADKEYFFSEDYFSKIFSIDKSKWKIFIVSLNNNPIGGGIVFENSNFFNIHLTASLIDYRNFHPNEILRDFIIERFSISASKIINFGGGKTGSLDDSLLKFKLKFSELTTNYNIYGLVVAPNIYTQMISSSFIKPESKFFNYFLKYRYSNVG